MYISKFSELFLFGHLFLVRIVASFNVSHSFWISFCLQTNYMQSITFILIAIRRWLLLFRFVCCVFSWVLSLTWNCIAEDHNNDTKKFADETQHENWWKSIENFNSTENRMCVNLLRNYSIFFGDTDTEYSVFVSRAMF